MGETTSVPHARGRVALRRLARETIAMVEITARTLARAIPPLVLVAAALGGSRLLRADDADAAAGGGAPQVTTKNGSGFARTIHVNGGAVIDARNPFFLSLGTNGRACVSCHVPSENMTITPAGVRARFEATGGLDPIFRPNDGSNSPLADVSSVGARRAAYSMLLRKGVIRIGIGIPAGAEFELAAVDDPYGFASAAELSLFRRPLPATNLTFLSTVMWDGRENVTPPSDPAHLDFDLAHQANGATLGHAQAAAPLTDEERAAIVAFETSLFTAQVFDDAAHDLAAAGATGGPEALYAQRSYFGINDVLGGDPTGAPFDPVVMTDFEAWSEVPGGGVNAARRAVARGAAIFNTRTFEIAGVAGLNDRFFGGKPILGTCTVCHDAPNAGDHSLPAPLDIGIADPHPVGGLDASGLPVYTLRNRATGATVSTTDPGRALVSGKWADVGKFKGPVLRGLAGRAPYFHNGSAATLLDVVDFYEARFGIGLTAEEKADLAAFLRSL
jgi:hypothetical protein